MNRQLTCREIQVLKLIAAGRSNLQVAEALNVSQRTVESHRSRLMMKLDLKGLAGLVRYAIREHLIDP